MKTTTKKSATFSSSGTMHRRDKNGDRMYTIWPDGSIWIYGENDRVDSEMDTRGGLVQWSEALNRWVESMR